MAISVFIHDKNGPKVNTGYAEAVHGTHKVTYEGAVLFTGEHNYRDDSDFYALVWDDVLERVIKVEYATTRGWTYLNGASVDATPEVEAKAKAYFVKLYLEHLKSRAAADAKKPAKGKRVKVVKGRKVPVGLEGVVFWEGMSANYAPVFKRGGYSRSTAAPRIGFRTDDGATHFLAASNVEVLDPEEWITPLEELEARAAHADIHTYRGLTSHLTVM